MTRSLCLLLLVAGPVAAQEPEIPTRKLTVTAAAAPIPALRYKLLPDLRDTTPGNAALLYYRAFAPEWSSAVRGNKDLQNTINDAMEKSPAELRALTELHFVRDWTMLKEVDRAARRAYCDWELTPRLREEGVSLLIPDIQEFRRFAQYLRLRNKLELADKQFTEAAHSLQTGFQLGRHVADGPTLIQALVGLALTSIMLNDVEDWQQVPGSPNLYWALSALPQPYIDLRKPYQGERLMLDNLLPGFREALVAGHMRPLSVEQVQELVAKLGQIVGEQRSMAAAVALTLVAKKYTPAKAFLKEQGWPAADVEAMPALQAVLLHEVATFDRVFDDMIKWQGQPYWIARPGLERAEQMLKEEVVSAGSPGMSLAGYLLPAITKVQLATTRTDRHINLLRVIEALRIHAAAHGKFPQKLADVTEVPMPLDPYTGQAFQYRRDGDAAVITAPPPGKDRPHEGNSRRYVITLAK
jgi:hypothetical protein